MHDSEEPMAPPNLFLWCLLTSHATQVTALAGAAVSLQTNSPHTKAELLTTLTDCFPSPTSSPHSPTLCFPTMMSSSYLYPLYITSLSDQRLLHHGGKFLPTLSQLTGPAINHFHHQEDCLTQDSTSHHPQIQQSESRVHC